MKNWIGVWVFIYSLAALAESPPPAPAEASQSIPEAAAESSWLSQVQQDLAQREYQFNQSELGLQAPNRAQGFRSYFSPDGVQLVQRSAESESLGSLSLLSVGRVGAEMTLGAAQVFSEGSRATLQWPEITIQYDNEPSGLHQAITVDQSPAGSGLLEIVLMVTDAEPQVSGSGIGLISPAMALQLGAIEANDAAGFSLPVTITAAPGTIRLTVSDKSATYPIKLQSVINGSNNGLLQSDQAAAQLGYSVAGAGDVNGDGYADVIVGAPTFDNGELGEGAAFIYFGGSGTFSTGADAHLEPDQNDAQMGRSVAGAGDVNGDGYADVIVGVRNYDNGETDEGAAFIYFGGPGAFNTTADAMLETNQVDAEMGRSVASAGDVNGDGYADVIVGVERYDFGEMEQGAAFIYFGGSGAFDTIADAQLVSNQAGAFMGGSAAGVGDVNGDGYADVIVGAEQFENDQATTNEGAAFIYFGGPGAFNATADALLESNQLSAFFGNSVAGAGDVNGDGYADVIVGANLYNNGQTDEGAAFIYFGGPGTFNPTPDALLESNQAEAQMGSSVAGAGDINGDGYGDVIVGAPLYDNNVNDASAAEGSAFVYFGGPGDFNADSDALLTLGQAGAGIGSSVSGVGDVNGDGYADVIVGADSYDNGQLGEGAAFIYFGGAGEFSTSPDGQVESDVSFGEAGFSVAGAGDVNADGYSDVVVGVPGYDNGQDNEGAAFLYLGGSGNFDTIVDAVLESNQVGARLGWSVGGAGDVNGDGFADVIAGAINYANGQANEGAAFIFLGGTSPFDPSSDAILQSNEVGALMGYSVAGAGDVNGDGYADIVVGATEYDNTQINEGVAFVYFGGAGAFNTDVDALLEANQTNAGFGNSVAGAGDVNGDGFADVLVGAPRYDNEQDAEGAAFVYFGGEGSFNTVADAQLERNQAGALMGYSVAGAGDVNGDGYSDVIVGAYNFDNGQEDEGAAFIYFGGGGTFNTTADAVLERNQAGALMGYSVAGAGDVNGDGYADVIVGSLLYSNGQNNEGGATIYLGGSGSFNTGADAQLESNTALAKLGSSIAGAGDVNGDGYADVIVGANGFINGQTNEGAAFVYFGTNRGRPVLAKQFQGNATSPVQPWGFSQDTDGFVASLNATSPRGRERARLQLEACPNGAPFDSLLCDNYVAANWTEIGANPQGVSLTLAASGLTLDKLYHWRARVQYAPLHINAPGVVAPANPSAGPWRRLQANGDVADIRTSVNTPPAELIFEDGFE